MTETPEKWLQAASRLRQMNRVPEAIAAYERVLSRWPDLPNSWYNLGLLQRQAGRLQPALSSYRKALSLGISAPEEVHLNCSVIYMDLHQEEAAESELRTALRLNPGYVPALLNLANLCEDLGRRDEACDLYRQVLALEPKRYEALARLANAQPSHLARASTASGACTTPTTSVPATAATASAPCADAGPAADASDRGPSAMVAALRRALADPTASPAEKASLGFALGRLLDDQGDYDGAFAAYRQGNLDSRISAGAGFRAYDRGAQEMFVEALMRAFPRPSPGGPILPSPLLEMPDSARQSPDQARQIPDSTQGMADQAREIPDSTRQFPDLARRITDPAWQAPDVAQQVPNPAQQKGPAPIFICGMFRSGSTLAERLLASHPGIEAGGELGLIPGLVNGPLRPFPASMASVSAEALARLAGGYSEELGRRCAGASYATDKRPDNFLYLGLIKRLFPQAKIVHTTREPLDNCLSVYFLHLDHGMSYALDLRDIGHYYRQYRRVMAHWQALYGEDILDFEYDAFVRDPKPAGERLFEFLGLDWQDGYLGLPARGAVRTASVWQVRESIYRRSSGRSRHYRKWLEELERELRE
ncbi:MAG TPA: sulfotransferase [Steroidobacteraceae bacterium]|nr:sulfotransferase [Steroidobacteraceae bacterium]